MSQSLSSATILPSAVTATRRHPGPANPFVAFPGAAIEQSIPERFEQHVDQNRHHIAVKTAGHELTYDALNRAANRIARAILARRGPAEEPVAFLLDHGAPQISAILGILKAGKTYVPLDAAFPPARSAFMVENSQASLLLTDSAHQAQAEALCQPGCQVLKVEILDPNLADDNVGLSVAPERDACLLYTSGSAGQPKGVLHNHRNLLHSARAYTNALHIHRDDRVLLLASCSFAASVTDILSALLNGATLLPYHLQRQGLANLARWLTDQRVTTYHSVPTAFRQFVRTLSGQETFSDLRLIRLGGEVVTRKDVELYQAHFDPCCLMAIGLAATEVFPIRLYFLDRESRLDPGPVPVGYALEDREVLLLDDTGQEVGPGCVGEVAVRSPYLALGYWRNPELTRAAFQPDRERPELRVYHTGDLGRMSSDGCLELLGRKDFQVKIRGHRVEVSEIESALLDLGTIKEAAVLGREDGSGGQRLVAYVVPAATPAATARDWRTALQQRLPDFMIPSAFVLLDALPLTATGKIDHLALPTLNTARPALGNAFAPPEDPVQQMLVEAWEGLLNVYPIGIQDNFFELGGDSLLAASLLAQLERLFGRTLTPDVLLAGATVEHLAEVLLEQAGGAAQQPLVEIQAGDPARRFFFLHGDFSGGGLFCVNLARLLGKALAFYALQPHGLVGLVVPPTIEGMAADLLQTLLAFQPQGPYLLGGHCNGSLVALEMARQLRARGHQVDLVALVSPPALMRWSPPTLTWQVSAFLPLPTMERVLPVDLGRLPPQKRPTALREIYRRACANYYPRPYPGRVTVVLPLDEANSKAMPFHGKIAAQEVDVRTVAGNHFAILTKHVQELARCLHDCLQQAESEKTSNA